MIDLQETFWDNLLDYIQDRTVIPVIGSELVTVWEGGRDVPLYRWVAERLAADLKLPIGDLPEGFDLNDVVSLHARRRGEREELYAQIHRMLRNAALTPAEPLRSLAGIPGFDLFVSLTFDSLLADAIGAGRAGALAEQIAYSPSTVRDLACPKAALREPVVFHLLGRASVSPNYAICDEDLLEFLHAMQDKQRQPKNLFDELRSNHLLILGCSFGDWLARFFLRTARSLELSQKRRRWDVLVGDHIGHDARLVPVRKRAISRRVATALKIMCRYIGPTWLAEGATRRKSRGTRGECNSYRQAKPTPLRRAAENTARRGSRETQFSRWRASTNRLKLTIEPQT